MARRALREFSSALDAETERGLFAPLRAALEGKTLLLITHRASALELVDRTVELPRHRRGDGARGGPGP